MTTNTTTETVETTETVTVAQNTSSKLGRFTRKALIVIAVAGTVAGAVYYFNKAKAVVAEVAGEATEGAEEAPAAAAE